MASDRVDIRYVDGLQWVVVRTKPRAEKKVLGYCQGRGITAYLPLRRSVRRYQTRVREFQVPVFSGYIFCQTSVEDLSLINESQHVAHILRPDLAMEQQLITELKSLQVFEEAIFEGELTVRPEIEAGTPVVIKTGPMAGLYGIVTHWKNNVRLTVNVEMVGQSVRIEMDAGEVDVNV